MSNFMRVFESVQKNGGATFNVETGELNPTHGYMVSLHGHEVRYTIPRNLNEFQNIVINYFAKKSKFLKDVLDTEWFVGFWINDNQLFCDIVRLVTNKKQAIALGKENKQIGIFDNVNKRTIFLSYPTPPNSSTLLEGFSKGLLWSIVVYLFIVWLVVWYVTHTGQL